LAFGGVYLGGGIPPKILPALKQDLFLEAFTSKGRFRELLKQIPVRVILNERTALLGAAQGAWQMLPG
jgi:glucokinase